MTRNILIFIFSALIGCANAWEFELGAGQTKYTPHAVETGNWRQAGPASQGFRDEMNMSPNSFSLGVTGRFSSDWKWRAGYADLGKATSTATATKWDMDFDFNHNVCTRNCDALTTFVGSSEVQGVYGTLVREFRFGQWRPFVEGGLWVYRNKFKLWVYNPVGTSAPYYPDESYGLGDLEVVNKWSIGPVLGVGIGKNGTSLALRAYTVRQSGGIVPANNDGKPYALNLSLNVEF